MNSLIGKTIAAVETRPVQCSFKGQTDDGPVYILRFTDSSYLEISAHFGYYTGDSCEEYPTFTELNLYGPDSIQLHTEDKESLPEGDREIQDDSTGE